MGCCHPGRTAQPLPEAGLVSVVVVGVVVVVVVVVVAAAAAAAAAAQRRALISSFQRGVSSWRI